VTAAAPQPALRDARDVPSRAASRAASRPARRRPPHSPTWPQVAELGMVCALGGYALHETHSAFVLVSVTVMLGIVRLGKVSWPRGKVLTITFGQEKRDD
jgi:hypothetical protein